MHFKKIILLILFTISTSSCCWFWPFGEDLYNPPTVDSSIEWHFKNKTDKKIILYRYYDVIRVSKTIPQYKDTLLDVLYTYTTDDEDDDFDRLWYGTSDSIEIQVNETIAKTWRKSERNNLGKQFFNSQFWTKSSETRDAKPCTVWTFEITPEDITLK